MADTDRYLYELSCFRASDEARDRLVSELINKYQALAHEHADLNNDYKSERDVRRNYQKIVEEHKQSISEYERQMEASSFVLALIDGDGAIFQDALLQAAAGDGGSEAASLLNSVIREHTSSLYSNSNNWPIMVHIYLSLDKLASKLAQVGLLRSYTELRTFAQRFSVNQPLFSIIDVGQGKERADHKIKEMLRTFSDNPTCRHIIFGGCHDAGYLLNLEQFKHNERKARRITLLETTPAYRGFADLALFKRARFDQVFRSDTLPESNNSTLPPAVAITNQPSIDASVPARPAINGSPSLQRSATDGPARRGIPSPPSSSPPRSVAESVDDSRTESSWATVGKSGALANGNIVIGSSTKGNKKKKWAIFNKEDERLDEPLPPKDSNSVASLEERMRRGGKKMCNHFHLGGSCEKGINCPFQHEPRLPTGELNALRYKTRSLGCKNKYCENVDCYLGHQCALERDFGKCHYPDSCNLRATHGMDKKPYIRYDRDGNAEYV